MIALPEYGGYYYLRRNDGTISVKLPGANIFFATLPNYEIFKRFVDQCNNVFRNAAPDLILHLTGCKRCAKSVGSTNPDYFDPCNTGAAIIARSQSIAQEISREIAKQFARWWEDEQRERLQEPDGQIATKDTTPVSNL